MISRYPSNSNSHQKNAHSEDMSYQDLIGVPPEGQTLVEKTHFLVGEKLTFTMLFRNEC